MKRATGALALTAAMLLSGCLGGSDLEAAAVGGLIGCAAGEVFTEGRCVEGAVVGAGTAVLTN